MTISTLPTPPSRADDPSNFSSKSDALLGALPTFVTEANAAVTVINAASANVDVAIAAGLANAAANATTATTQAGIATTKADEAETSATNANDSAIAAAASVASIAGGPVASVNGKTGIAVLIPSDIAANASQAEMETGTEPAIRSMSPLRVKQAIVALAAASVGNHVVTVHTGNGHGSTNNKIRRFTTTMSNVGTAITYADSATMGGSFTINEAGIYAMTSVDIPTTNGSIGISLNSASGSTSITSIAAAGRLVAIQNSGAGQTACTVVAKLAASDVIRAHTDGNAITTTDTCYFSIRKIGV